MNAPAPRLHDASIPDAPATTDPVLAALHDARDRRDQADRDIRILLAYARELTSPRPYRLADLAAAAGMSISGVRTAYTAQHTDTAQQILRSAAAARKSHQRPRRGAHDLCHPAPQARLKRKDSIDTKTPRTGARER